MCFAVYAKEEKWVPWEMGVKQNKVDREERAAQFWRPRKESMLFPFWTWVQEQEMKWER